MQEEFLELALKENMDTHERFMREHKERVLEVISVIARALKAGKKLLICGNGGSAADAQHMAAEFVNRFLLERRPLPALSLTTDTSVLTSIGNDYGFDHVFEKQVRALGTPGDILIVISTSGMSTNCLKAVEAAKALGIYTIGLLGRDGGLIRPELDLDLTVRHPSTPRIQEVHIFLIHLICEAVERAMFGEGEQWKI